jgi:hypothetical protein
LLSYYYEYEVLSLFLVESQKKANAMPKYSTVQAYSDNSSNVQTVPYEQATAAAGAKGPGT